MVIAAEDLFYPGGNIVLHHELLPVMVSHPIYAVRQIQRGSYSTRSIF